MLLTKHSSKFAVTSIPFRPGSTKVLTVTCFSLIFSLAKCRPEDRTFLLFSCPFHFSISPSFPVSRDFIFQSDFRCALGKDYLKNNSLRGLKETENQSWLLTLIIFQRKTWRRLFFCTFRNFKYEWEFCKEMKFWRRKQVTWHKKKAWDFFVIIPSSNQDWSC